MLKKEIHDEISQSGRKTYCYNTEEFDFVKHIRELFNCYDLTRIHEIYRSDFDVLTFETDQATIFHKMFYSMNRDSEFYQIYKRFIKNNIAPLFSEEIIYQKIPTFRTQVPNNISVAEWHRDSDYNHAKEEWNIFLPLTKAYESNTIWAETKRDKKDFLPMTAEVGQFYLWQGSNLIHGNKINETGKSRVSVDFRVMPLSLYKDNDRTSTSNETKMIIGDYFDICE
jgi:hypothetical protein